MHTKFSDKIIWETTTTIINGTPYQLPKSYHNPDHIPGCRKTWLIQRISRSGVESKDNLPSCSFDYMGSAEFEFGTIPKAFEKMRECATKNELVAYPLDVFGPPEFSWEICLDLDLKEVHKMQNRHILEITLFVLTPRLLVPHVNEVLQTIAFGEEHLKECTNLRESIFGIGNDGATCAWFELDNGFMFFSDIIMWVKFSNYFGVRSPDIEGLNIKTADFSEVKNELEVLVKQPA